MILVVLKKYLVPKAPIPKAGGILSIISHWIAPILISFKPLQPHLKDVKH
jgi:hypothetical protein